MSDKTDLDTQLAVAIDLVSVEAVFCVLFRPSMLSRMRDVLSCETVKHDTGKLKMSLLFDMYART